MPLRQQERDEAEEDAREAHEVQASARNEELDDIASELERVRTVSVVIFRSTFASFFITSAEILHMVCQ